MPAELRAAPVLVCANGEPPPPGLLARLTQRHAACLATDGAADWMQAQGYEPDVLLGDLDSASEAAVRRARERGLVPTPDQEACDLEKAIAWALAQGAAAITVVGATGRRFDHTLTSVSVLIAYHRMADIRLVEADCVTRACSDRLAITGRVGDRLSLCAMAPIDQITLEGVRWPLVREPLAPGSRGVSNALAGPVARLSVSGGVALVTHFPAGGVTA